MLRAPWIKSARRLSVGIGTVAISVALGTAGLGVSSASAAVPAQATAHKAVAKATTKTSTAKTSTVPNLPNLHGLSAVAAHRAVFDAGVLREAAKHAGTPYVYGASGPGAFDCSGFTRYVYGQLGVSLAHSSYAQYGEVHHMAKSAAQAGDILFLNGRGHVAIYAGHGMMWDAPSPGGRVSLRPIYSSSYEVGRVFI